MGSTLLARRAGSHAANIVIALTTARATVFETQYSDDGISGKYTLRISPRDPDSPSNLPELALKTPSPKLRLNDSSSTFDGRRQSEWPASDKELAYCTAAFQFCFPPSPFCHMRPVVS